MGQAQASYDEYKENSTFERIHGEIVMLARPSIRHVGIAGNIYRIFAVYLRGKRCKVFMEPDVYLDDDNHFIPDLVVVCNRDIITAKRICGAPDLVVEILSFGTAKRDRFEKKDAYERSGVKEYWIVNPKDQSVEVYHRHDDRLVLDDVYYAYSDEEWNELEDEEKAKAKLAVKVSLYDDLEIEVKDIFEDIDGRAWW